MKKLFLLFAITASLATFAQTKEGRVVYERTTQMPAQALRNLPADIQVQVPKSRTAQYELLFGPEHSLWQNLPNAANEDAGNFAAGGIVIRMADAGNETSFVDFAQGTRIDQREMFERSFVVSDTVAKLKWRLSSETKPVLNFTAHKATATSIVTRPRMTMENGEMKREIFTDTVPVVAWYTTEVPVPAGPDFAGQLPGLILELDVNNGQSLTKTIEFSPKSVATKIKAPTDGKRMTAAEFTKEREKMMEEMRRNMPAGNVFRVN